MAINISLITDDKGECQMGSFSLMLPACAVISVHHLVFSTTAVLVEKQYLHIQY